MKRSWIRSACRVIVPVAGLFALVSGARSADAARCADAVCRAGNEEIAAAYLKLPLRFEANRGQTDAKVRFISRGNGYSLFLTPAAAVLRLQAPPRDESPADRVQRRSIPADPGAVLRMRLLGARPAPEVVGADQLKVTTQYFTGADRSAWKTGVENFARVLYQRVYPGIDLAFHGTNGRLEYDFVVAPGADPSRIALRFDGADRVRLAENGDLALEVGDREVRFEKPVTYQDIGGRRIEVASRYVVRRDGRIAFSVASYDRSAPLIIDPTLAYSTFFGGSANADMVVRGLAIDSDGMAYVAGYTNSTNLPTTVGAIQTADPENTASQDAFVAKFDPSKSGAASLLYASYLGGSAADQAHTATIGPNNRLYVGGLTDSGNFPVTANAFQRVKGAYAWAATDAFVAVIDTTASGTAGLVYSTFIGGNCAESVGDLVVDAAGVIYAAGDTCSLDFPVTANALRTSQWGSNDGTILKLDPSKTGAAQLLYSTRWGGYGLDFGVGIALDASGRVYVGGFATSTGVPVTAGALQSSHQGGQYDGMVAVMNLGEGGPTLLYGSYFGGPGTDVINAIAVDSTGKLFIGGGSSGVIPITVGAIRSTFAGPPYDGFVAKLDTTKSALASLVWSTYLGGSGDDLINGVATDAAGDVYVAGYTSSPSFPTTAGAFQNVLGGGQDAFVSKLRGDGTALLYSTLIGGTGEDRAAALAVAPNGSKYYIAGVSTSPNFPTTASGFRNTLAGGQDSFLAVLNVSDVTPPVTTATVTPPPNAAGWNNSSSVEVALSAADETGGSGVKEITFSATGAFPIPQTTMAGGTATVVLGPVEGITTVTFFAKDNDGNVEATKTIQVKTDATAPSISGTRSPGANPFGWSNTPVTVYFTCTDGAGSGLSTCAAPVLLRDSAANQSVTRSVTDLAGNTGTGSVTGINIDSVPPTLTVTATPAPNANGWNNTDVTATFACEDSLSGIPYPCPAPVVLSREGTNLRASAATADRAGNVANASATGINIDKTAPSLTATRSPEPNASGWNNTAVTVAFACEDALSGVDVCPAQSTVSAQGAAQSLKVSASDKAGNSAETTVGDINIDTTAPTIAATVPAPNANGWYKAATTVAFACEDALSGVASCPASVVVAEGAGQSVSGTATDRAGNSASTSKSGLNVDATPPAISAAQQPAANVNGWNNGDVTVTFTCTDALSGIESCTTPVALSSEAANQSAGGSARDKAGNEASVSYAPVNIDKTAPQVTATRTPAPNAAGWNNQPVTVSFGCADALSGVAFCSPAVAFSSETANARTEGTGTDKADNSRTVAVEGIRVDLTAPSIVARRSVEANAFGWNNGDVAVSFDCTDALSGVESCTPARVLSAEGAGQSVQGTASDVAGNSASAEVAGISIDKTAPSITATRDQAANAAGWNNTPVTVSFACTDALSGVASCAQPMTFASEGTNLSASGTAADKADNTASATLAGINIDLTAPSITGTRTPANAFGWTNADVAVEFACSDALSGIASCAPAQNVSLEGANQSVEGVAADKAGNSATTVVAGINVDKTAPVITATRDQAANAAGWNNGPVTVSFACTDALSGVASCAEPVTFASEGSNLTANGTATDKADNSASATVAAINIDLSPPSITGSRTPANAFGWTNADVAVEFACSDALSGVASCAPAQNVSLEGANQSVEGVAADKAGNSATTVVTGINVDKTAPVITAARDRAANELGWNNAPVTVTFSCDDALSGVASCAEPVTFASEGANLSAAGTATDKADNSASATVAGINIDLTAPSIAGTRTAANAFGWTNADVTVTFACSDALSGVARCSSAQSVSVEGANQSVEGVAADKAGNSATTVVAGINVDKTAPVITSSLGGAPNAAGWFNADVTVTFACADALSGIASCSPPVTLTDEGASPELAGHAADKAGNTASAVVSGIRIDKTAPAIQAPEQVDAEATGAAGAIVAFDVSATDAVSGLAGDVSCVPAAGATFPIGETTVRCSATDLAGNSAAAVVLVTVVDTTPPVLTAVAPIVAEASGPTGAPVTFTAPTATDIVDGEVAANCDRLSGSVFALGVTTVTCSASDAHGNAASTRFTVTVRDTTAPAITGTADVSAYATSAAGATVSYAAPTASDLVDGTVAVTCAPASGSTFAPGSTLVTCTATDAAGNKATKTFTVKVTFEAALDSTFFLAPIKSDWSSLFKLGSTVPVKFRLQGASAAIADLPAKIYVAKVSNGVIGTYVEALPTGNADSGNTFRYDAMNRQYIFNLSSKSLSGGTWSIKADLGDGVLHMVQVSFKS